MVEPSFGPVETCWQTDYKRFKEDPTAVCGIVVDPTAKLYKTGVWNYFRNVYIRYYDQQLDETYTVQVPRDTTVGQYCAFLGFSEGRYQVLGHVDHNEFWLLVSAIVLFVWGLLAFNSRKQRKVPAWYWAGIIGVGVYLVFRWLNPETSGRKWAALTI